MREEIASLVLGEIENLIQRLEELEKKLPEQNFDHFHRLYDEKFLPQVEKKLEKMSQDYTHALHQQFKSQLEETQKAVRVWDREVIEALQLTRRNALYLFVLSFFSGMVGAAVVLFAYSLWP